MDRRRRRELIVGYVADNEHDEARFVAGEIDALADRGEISYNDVAVFYRTNNSSRALEEVFIRAGIPYKVVGGVRFYERKGDSRHRRLSAGAGQSRRRGQPTAHPEHSAAWHR